MSNPAITTHATFTKVVRGVFPCSVHSVWREDKNVTVVDLNDYETCRFLRVACGWAVKSIRGTDTFVYKIQITSVRPI